MYFRCFAAGKSNLTSSFISSKSMEYQMLDLMKQDDEITHWLTEYFTPSPQTVAVAHPKDKVGFN